MKKASTDPLLYLPMLESSPLTFIYTEAKSMTGVVVDTHKIHPSVMDSANGSSPDAGLSRSMYQSQGISNCATANCLRMLHSAMELINIFIDGQAKIIEVSGVFRESYHSGPLFHTGCLLSTSERSRFSRKEGERTFG